MEKANPVEIARCSDCGHVKPFGEFYVKSSGLGIRPYCKACSSKRCSEHYSQNKPEYKTRIAAWQRANPDKVRSYREKYDPAKSVPRIRKWRQDNPEKLAAHNAVARELRSGRLSKPSHCQMCGTETALNILHAHHRSYERKHWLDIIWLCGSCHARKHSNTPVG